MIQHPAKFAVAAAAVLLATLPVQARWAIRAEEVPLERVVPNVQRYIDNNPADAAGYYVLGRLHSMAWAQGAGEISVVPAGGRGVATDKKDLPGFAPYHSIQVRNPKPENLTPEARIHLLESIWYYQTAVQIEPKNPLYQLGLAWMQEQAMAYPPGVTGRPQQEWRTLALASNTKAYDLTKAADLEKPGLGPSADSSISLEAAQAMLRLNITPAAAEEDELRELKAHVEKMNKKGRAVTPIVIPLHGEANLSSLLAPATTVKFDLGGTERGERWEWVAPQTGILAWDPNGTGQINSGRQLFGSVTWWMFWKNGYQSLASLDDDGNGRVEGKELKGLVIWRDANQNGVSDPGEVKPLAEWGIESLGTKVSGTLDGGSLVSNDGVRWSDGRVTASYDWVARSR